MSICNVCNRCLFPFPSEIEMAEQQECFFHKIYPYDLTSKFQEVEIASELFPVTLYKFQCFRIDD